MKWVHLKSVLFTLMPYILEKFYTCSHFGTIEEGEKSDCYDHLKMFALRRSSGTIMFWFQGFLVCSF